MKINLIAFCLFLASLIIAPLASAQTVAFQSATLGDTGVTSGFSITAENWSGVRFSTEHATQVTSLGVHVFGRGDFVAAIFPNNKVVASNLALKNDAIFKKSFSVTEPSAEVVVRTNFNLPAGNWVLVIYGTGFDFDAGTGGIPHNNPKVGNPLFVFATRLEGDFYPTWHDSDSGAQSFVPRMFVRTNDPQVCGDEFVEAPESCDPGDEETEECDADCTAVVCGDGHTNFNAFEDCDDANLINGDGCSATCELESTSSGCSANSSSAGFPSAFFGLLLIALIALSRRQLSAR